MKTFESDALSWKKEQDDLSERISKLEEKMADSKLHKAQKAIKNTDSSLKMLSRALYVGYILSKNPDLKELSKFTKELGKPASELSKYSDKIVELAEKQKDKTAAENESKGLLDKVKLFKIKSQAEELERLAKKIRELPVGLVSEDVDDNFVVTVDMLIKAPKQAEAWFKSYLDAMTTNIEYLRSQQEPLDEAGEVARNAVTLFRELQSAIEKAIAFSGPYAKPLTEFYLEVDNLAKAYGGLASDCASKAKDIKRAVEVEQRRRENLKVSVRTLFGFGL